MLWERLTEGGRRRRPATRYGSTRLLPGSADLGEPAPGSSDRIIDGDTSGVDIDAALAEFEVPTPGPRRRACG